LKNANKKINNIMWPPALYSTVWQPKKRCDIVETIEPKVEFAPEEPARREHIAAVHTDMQIQEDENQGFYKIANPAAGVALRAAQIGLSEPCF
jgi:hypothetical protein